jgi:hypothetical protein
MSVCRRWRSPLFADPEHYPLTHQYLHAKPLRLLEGWLPDAVTDTTAKRSRRAQRLLGDGCGVLSRLWAVGGGVLTHVVVRLPRELNLYLEAPQAARLELEHLFGTAARYVRVALGRAGQLHIHALVVVKAGTSAVLRGSYGPVYTRSVTNAADFMALAAYFSRPNDERASRPGRIDTLRYTRAQLAQQRLAASELYLNARLDAGKRLPHLAWSSNVPRLRSDAVNATEVNLPQAAPEDVVTGFQRPGHEIATPDLHEHLCSVAPAAVEARCDVVWPLARLPPPRWCL